MKFIYYLLFTIYYLFGYFLILAIFMQTDFYTLI